MRSTGWILALVLAGCEPMPPSGSPLEPARVEPPQEPRADVVEAAPPPEGTFDFEAEDRDDTDVAPGTADPLEEDDLAAGLGLPEPGPEEPTPEPLPLEPAPPPPVQQDTGAPGAPRAWQPGDALDVSWGVRVLSTLPEAQPPRAVLGLPDGTEEVVQPGTLLPDAGLVVLAIGRDAVQVAEVKAQGDRAVVQTQVIQALYPRNGASAQR